MRNALYATLTATLGLSNKDIAEIGGWKGDRMARYIMAGDRNWPDDVKSAILDIQDDIDVMTDSIIAQVEGGDGAIFVFRDNAQLRELFPQWPGRGKASGGFVGPHRIAAITARDEMEERGIDVDILFYPNK